MARLTQAPNAEEAGVAVPMSNGIGLLRTDTQIRLPCRKYSQEHAMTTSGVALLAELEGMAQRDMPKTATIVPTEMPSEE